VREQLNAELAAAQSELAAVREQLGAEAAATHSELAGQLQAMQAAQSELAGQLEEAQAALAAEGQRLQAELDQAQSVALALVAEKEQLEVGGWAGVMVGGCVMVLICVPEAGLQGLQGKCWLCHF